MNDPWEGIFIPSLNQPLDVNGDGNYDAYFYDTDKIADEKYAAIGVYVGTNKSNVLNVKPVQGGYLMEYNYAGNSSCQAQVSTLYSSTGGSNSVQYESKPESGLVIKGVS